MSKFRVYKQLDSMDCGPTCLRMVTRYHGKSFPLEYLRKLTYTSKVGVSMLGLSEASEKLGLKSMVAKITFEQLDSEVSLPCIIHWKENHFVVVPPQDYSINDKKSKLLVADPSYGLVKVDRETFKKYWLGPNDNTGLVLILEPTSIFFDQKDIKEPPRDFSFLLGYLAPYKRLILQLVLGMFVGSLLSLIFPFLTQSLVDNGVNHKDIGFIRLILVSQVALIIGTSAIEMIRGWIFLHMNSRLNLSLISDYLIKLMKLPVNFFDTKLVGDIFQRVSDHSRIEGFLTNTILSTLFSFVNLILFSIVLWYYSAKIAIIFLTGSILSIIWISFFLKYRKHLDYKNFQEQAASQSSLHELIVGMQDIKLNGSELQKRWQWEGIQIQLFKLRIKGLSLEQYQKMGNIFFLQLKNVFISYFAASETVNGTMTLGMMLSVSYIIGQMNSPIEQLLNFMRSAQDAKISLERLNEINRRENEEYSVSRFEDVNGIPHVGSEVVDSSTMGDIKFQDVSFQYAGPSSPLVVKNVSFVIPKGKVTAIVGMSGSGKTTLLKLLLKFYDPIEGAITLNGVDLKTTSPRWWRTQCGVVMQDGFIFSDTIASNIALGAEYINQERLNLVARIANIHEFIRELPLGFNTKIGNTGIGISSGQRLRILIARAIYKNPQYLFFDEATSVLDATNEKIIMENLGNFIDGRTVIYIAHRLSTVKSADQIVVMDKGVVVEIGSHRELTAKKGKYYQLVKNQLEVNS